MMRFNLLIGLLITYGSAGAQTLPPVTDSSGERVVLLKEVWLPAVKTPAAAQISRFYQSNAQLTLEEILQRVPDADLIRRGSYGMEPVIRGFAGGQINVLIDGMRIHGACTDKMDPPTIYVEPANLEAIQIKSGAQGIIAGSSVGGTLNLQMNEPAIKDKPTWTGQVQQGYQSAAGSWMTSAKTGYSNTRWAVEGGAVYRKQHNYRNGHGTEVDYSGYEKVNYYLHAKYQLKPHLLLKADLLGDDGWNIGYTALPMDVGYAGARIASIQLRGLSKSRYLKDWSVRIYGNQVRHFMDDTHRPNVPMHMDMPGESRTAGMIAAGNWQFRTKGRLQLQADATQTFLKASMTMYQTGQLPMYMLTWPDNLRLQTGLGGVYTLQLDARQRLTAGARMDYFSHTIQGREAKDQQAIVAPGFESRQDLLKNFSIRYERKSGMASAFSIQLGYAERMPTATELFGFYLFNASDGYDYIGNVHLKPEQAVQLEAGWHLQTPSAAVQITATASHIANWTTGVLQPAWSTMTIGARGVKQFQQSPEAWMTGVYASSFVQLNEALSLVSSMKFTYGADHNGQPLPGVAPLKFTQAIRWRSNGWMLQLETEMAAAQNRIQRQAGEDATPGFVLIHIRGAHAWMLGRHRIDLQGGCENLTDQYYYQHNDWGNIPRPGLNAYLQVQWSF